MNADRQAWEDHWEALQGERSWFGRVASWVRRGLLSRAVAAQSRRYFLEGWVLEAGCGTGQASARIIGSGCRLIGADFSLAALLVARGEGVYDQLVRCDITALPFRAGSLAGAWNLGVMEHFTPAEGAHILRELGRVLRDGAAVVLFWPPVFGASRLVFGPIEWVRSLVTGRRSEFFPAEVNRLRSFAHARGSLVSGGLVPTACHFDFRDGFIHLVVVGRRKARQPS